MEAHAADRSPSADGVAEAAPVLRSILRNGISLAGAYVLPRLFTFAAAVVAARALGVVQFGAWGSAAALAVIVSVTATLGMMPLLVREIAREPARSPALIGAANLAKLFTTAAMLGVVGLVAVGPLSWQPTVVVASLLLALAYAVGAFAENLGAYFQGIERMEIWMQAQALYGLVTGTLGIILAVATRDLLWFCAAPVVGQLAALVWLAGRAPRAIRLAWTAPFAEVRRLLVDLAPFAGAFLLLTAYYKVDIILLDRWRGAGEAGVYAAAYRFMDIAQALSVVVASALYPRLSRLGGTPGRPAARAVELLLLAVVPAACALWLVRRPLIAVLFGTGYGASADALAWLAPALPFLALNALATFVLAAAGRIRVVALACALALVLNVALNVAWIPSLGATGAARAMLLSEMVLGLLMVVSLGRAAGALPRLAATVPVAAAAMIAVGIGSSALPPIAGTSIYAVVVIGVYVAFRVLPATERAILRRALTG